MGCRMASKSSLLPCVGCRMDGMESEKDEGRKGRKGTRCVPVLYMTKDGNE